MRINNLSLTDSRIFTMNTFTMTSSWGSIKSCCSLTSCFKWNFVFLSVIQDDTNNTIFVPVITQRDCGCNRYLIVFQNDLETDKHRSVISENNCLLGSRMMDADVGIFAKLIFVMQCLV